eukprot:6271279-Prymnesium_polylepis.1
MVKRGGGSGDGGILASLTVADWPPSLLTGVLPRASSAEAPPSPEVEAAVEEQAEGAAAAGCTSQPVRLRFAGRSESPPDSKSATPSKSGHPVAAAGAAAAADGAVAGAAVVGRGSTGPSARTRRSISAGAVPCPEDFPSRPLADVALDALADGKAEAPPVRIHLLCRGSVAADEAGADARRESLVEGVVEGPLVRIPQLHFEVLHDREHLEPRWHAWVALGEPNDDAD